MNHAGEETYPSALRGDSMIEDEQEQESYSEGNTLDNSMKPKGTDDTATATTSGSIHGGSRSSQAQERSTEGILEGRFISTSYDASSGKKNLMVQNQGLEKLEAYVLNDENELPGDDACSKVTQDEEFSLHLSRPTGTGSQQLELWIREVNMAVRGPPAKILTTETTEPVSTLEHPIAASSPRSRMALSPTGRIGQLAFSPSAFSSPNKKGYVSPSKRSIASARSPVNFGGAHSKGRRPRGVLAEDIHPEDPRFHEVTPKVQNSQVIMASIEDKYKNLRDNLIREPSLEEPPSSEGEEERDEDSRSSYQSPRRRPQNETAQVHNLVSRGLASTSRNANRNDYSVQDHFSLGMLSTRSSGILSGNSWTSASSFESQSERSGISFLPGKGCGLFLCE
jgi:hypothetical protein